MEKKDVTLISISLVSVLVLLTTLKPLLTQKDTYLSSTLNLVTYMKKYKSINHLKQFTFIQETIRFNQEGKAQDTSTWYEAIRYPKDFRIDFGDPNKGNANINRNDSVYVYRGNKLVHSGPEIQEFLILEGGLFYYSADETIERLESLGIDTKIFSKSQYKGKEVYVIGAIENDFSKPQIWLDAKELYSVRRFSKGKKGELYEVRYDDYKDIGGYKIETWIEFYADDKLIQTERYNQIDVNPNLDDNIFNPNLFGNHYWFTN